MADDLDRARALKAQLEQAAAIEQAKAERLQASKPGAARSTSAAKHYDPDALARARAAKDGFNRAAAGQQKDIDRLQGQKADERQNEGRTTSASKHYSPDLLARAQAAKELFDRAADPKQKDAAQSRSGRDAGSKTSHTPAPGMHLQPKDPAQRDGPNRQTFDKDRGALYLDKLKDALAQQRDATLRQSKDRDKDRERE